MRILYSVITFFPFSLIARLCVCVCRYFCRFSNFVLLFFFFFYFRILWLFFLSGYFFVCEWVPCSVLYRVIMVAQLRAIYISSALSSVMPPAPAVAAALYGRVCVITAIALSRWWWWWWWRWWKEKKSKLPATSYFIGSSKREGYREIDDGSWHTVCTKSDGIMELCLVCTVENTSRHVKERNRW